MCIHYALMLSLLNEVEPNRALSVRQSNHQVRTFGSSAKLEHAVSTEKSNYSD